MAKKVKIGIVVPPLLAPTGTAAAFAGQVSEHLENEVGKALLEKPDLVLLPENCDFPADFSTFPRDEFIHARGLKVQDALARLARLHHCNIAYSSKYADTDGKLVNGIRILDRSGKLSGEYIKNFPTISEMEQGVTPGVAPQIIETDCGRLAPLICFDLNFDELRLAYAGLKPDILLFSSVFHGGLLQQYWAYSCRSFFAGAVGPAYTQPSAIVAPNTRILAETTNYFNIVTRVINLDRVLLHLDYNRPLLAEIRKKYGPEVEIDDTGRLGSVLLYSNSDDFTTADLIAAYGLETLDDYLRRSQAAAAEVRAASVYGRIEKKSDPEKRRSDTTSRSSARDTGATGRNLARRNSSSWIFRLVNLR